MGESISVTGNSWETSMTCIVILPEKEGKGNKRKKFKRDAEKIARILIEKLPKKTLSLVLIELLEDYAEYDVIIKFDTDKIIDRIIDRIIDKPNNNKESIDVYI